MRLMPARIAVCTAADIERIRGKTKYDPDDSPSIH
jgi:hypothetical protein